MSKSCSKEGKKGFSPVFYTCKFSRGVSDYTRSSESAALIFIRNRKGHTMATALFSKGETFFPCFSHQEFAKTSRQI